jgi:hypothetical protein
MNCRDCLILVNVLVLGCVPYVANADPQATIEKLLAPPNIEAAKGLTAHLLIAPGTLYDPLIMLPMGESPWLNDDGGEEKDKGSRLLSISPSGEISILADIGKLLPTVGFDIAPAGFGSYAGQVYARNDLSIRQTVQILYSQKSTEELRSGTRANCVTDYF